MPFNRRRRKEKKGKESPLSVKYEKEERCMVDLAKVVDFAGDERHERMTDTMEIFACLLSMVKFERKEYSSKTSIQ